MNFLYERHNPWWHNRELIQNDIDIKTLDEQPLRYHHPLLKKTPTQKGILVIRGPRRIGKTTLMKLLIQKLLLTARVPPKRVLFYPCNRLVDFNQLFDLLMGYLGTQAKTQHLFIFLDELTFVNEWQRTIKDLWDSGELQNTTLILTGSNALDLEFSSERLPGRRGQLTLRDIDYWPLRFADFCQTVGTKKPSDQLLKDYLLCGGFPQSINEYYAKGFISNTVYDDYLSWIEGDIHKAGKSEKLMYAIFREVFKHLGSRASWYGIAKDSGITSHSTVTDYLDILDKLFVTFNLNYYSVNQKKVLLNKNKKIYFTDPIILHAIKAKVEGFTDQYFQFSKENMLNEQWLPHFIENVVGLHLYTQPGPLFYGEYNQKEIDFVLKQKAEDFYYEVKYQKQIQVSSFSFWDCKKPLTVITPDFSLKRKNLSFVKLYEFLLNL